jgi:HNH endonuclease
MHGPDGYLAYESYRDWLRDDFRFRCVYCLHREQWYGRAGTFHIDHFVPVSNDEAGTYKYENLLYSCTTCNEAKKAILGLADPCKIAFGSCLKITSKGIVKALDKKGEKLIQSLQLNSPITVAFRLRMMKLLDLAKKSDPALYEEMMGFPEDLPDLRKKNVPSNSKPAGALNCFFALREKSKLPSTYF